MRKFIGLDVGDVRIGVAKCDPLGILATALEVIDRNITDPIKRIEKILEEENTKTIIVGMPKSLDGSKKRQVEKVEEFVEQLKENIEDLSINYISNRIDFCLVLKELSVDLQRISQNKYRELARRK